MINLDFISFFRKEEGIEKSSLSPFFQIPVTAVIIARDEENEIQGCLKSVIASHPDEIIVVVDDRTKDSTFQKAKELTKSVFVVKGFRSGLRNFGWKKARNNSICFVEADMRLPENYFSSMLAERSELEKNIDAHIAVFGARLLPLGDALCGKLEWMLWHNARIFSTAGVIYKKDVLASVGGLNENLESGEDADLTRRIEAKGYKRRLADKTHAYHRFAQTWKVMFDKWQHGSVGLKPKTLLLLLASPVRAPIIALKYRCWHILWFYPFRWFYLFFFSGAGKKDYNPIPR